MPRPTAHCLNHCSSCVQDGITELNTFCLIARRQWRSCRRLFSWLYWITFALMRMVLYPVLLPIFYRHMQGFAWWEQAAVCGAQLVLIIFNVVLLALSWINWRKRAAVAAQAQRIGGAAAVSRKVAAVGCTAQFIGSEGKPGAVQGPTAVTVRARG